ncbi:MAG: DUF4037 domain-containing protein [Streptosporangiaceae bacterium]
MTTTFIPGLELARLYYVEAVRPLLDAHVPGLPHSAALVGPGSEVLGFDTPRSTDHDWGPRLQLFLSDEAADAGAAARVGELLASRLPASFRGYPTVFARSGTRPGWRPTHHVLVAGLRSWLTGLLGFDPLAPIALLDWLATPTQMLAEVTGGAVYHDGLAGADASLEAVRARLSWYPRDVWLHLMACQWQRIGQEEPFPGRCAEVGDELGSIVVTARLASDLMRLALLMQRRYPPYSKWLGTALARTAAGRDLPPLLSAALSAGTWREREYSLSRAYESVARLHNAIGVTPPLDPAVRPTFYDRPYQIPDAGRFVRALRDQIRDESVRSLPLTGAVDQFIDSTDALGDRDLRRAATEAQLPPGVSGTDPAPTAA